MIYAFDLDGTLVDSREANVRAYQAIGIDPPSDFHVRPWQEWTTVEAHDAKNVLFARFAREHIQVLPLLYLAQRLGGHVLSMCSVAALDAIKENVFLGTMREVRCEMSILDKVKYLSAFNMPGVYWDDSTYACETMARLLRGWQICHVQR